MNLRLGTQVTWKSKPKILPCLQYVQYKCYVFPDIKLQFNQQARKRGNMDISQLNINLIKKSNCHFK